MQSLQSKAVEKSAIGCLQAGEQEGRKKDPELFGPLDHGPDGWFRSVGQKDGLFRQIIILFLLATITHKAGIPSVMTSRPQHRKVWHRDASSDHGLSSDILFDVRIPRDVLRLARGGGGGPGRIDGIFIFPLLRHINLYLWFR